MIGSIGCAQITMSDEELVEKIRSGETGLYEVLVSRYDGRLHRTTNKYLQGDSEAEDIVQEAHLRAFAHLRQFNGLSSFPTWLTRIAINQAFTYLRTRSRTEGFSNEENRQQENTFTFRSTLRDPEQDATNQELRRALKAAVNDLAPAYRTVFVLREIEQLSTTEVVERLGISETCAKSRLHRARKQLRNSLRGWARHGSRRSSKRLRAGVTTDRAAASSC